MATIAVDRPGTYTGLYQAPRIMLPIVGSLAANTLVPGDAVRVVVASGRINALNAANVILISDPLAGFLETPQPATSVAADLYQVTLILPYCVYEMNKATATTHVAVAADLFLTLDGIEHTASGFPVVDTGVASSSITTIQIGGFQSTFTVHGFIGANAATATAGQTVTPNPNKGTIGDTNCRNLVTFVAAVCQAVI